MSATVEAEGQDAHTAGLMKFFNILWCSDVMVFLLKLIKYHGYILFIAANSTHKDTQTQLYLILSY